MLRVSVAVAAAGAFADGFEFRFFQSNGRGQWELKTSALDDILVLSHSGPYGDSEINHLWNFKPVLESPSVYKDDRGYSVRRNMRRLWRAESGAMPAAAALVLAEATCTVKAISDASGAMQQALKAAIADAVEMSLWSRVKKSVAKRVHLHSATDGDGYLVKCGSTEYAIFTKGAILSEFEMNHSPDRAEILESLKADMLYIPFIFSYARDAMGRRTSRVEWQLYQIPVRDIMGGRPPLPPRPVICYVDLAEEEKGSFNVYLDVFHCEMLQPQTHLNSPWIVAFSQNRVNLTFLGSRAWHDEKVVKNAHLLLEPPRGGGLRAEVVDGVIRLSRKFPVLNGWTDSDGRPVSSIRATAMFMKEGRVPTMLHDPLPKVFTRLFEAGLLGGVDTRSSDDDIVTT